MFKMNVLGWIAFLLLLIGGLNWGLVGLFDFDMVAAIFGVMSPLARIVYIVVCLAAIYMAATCCKSCKPKTTS